MPPFQAAARDGLSTTFHGKYTMYKVLGWLELCMLMIAESLLVPRKITLVFTLA